MSHWNVIIDKNTCPFKYSEMHDSKRVKLCGLTREPCEIELCSKKEAES